MLESHFLVFVHFLGKYIYLGTGGLSVLLKGSSHWPEPPGGRRHHHHDHQHHHQYDHQYDHQHDQSDESDESDDDDDAEDDLVDKAHEVVVGPPSLVEFLKIFQDFLVFFAN